MKKYIPLYIILAIGLALRFYHNLDISIWHDEAFSALMIRYPWGEMFHRLGLDVHPPMYYIFLRLWHYVFGDSVLSLRGMSVFFGTGTIWAAWMFVREAFKNEKIALWAALLVAINPFGLRFALEARMYTMGAFFAVLAGYFLVRALNTQKLVYETGAQNMPNLPGIIQGGKTVFWNYLGFALSTARIINSHYYLFFTAAALGFYGLLYLFVHHLGSWKKYIPLLSSFIVIGLSFLPWLKTFLFQLRQVEAGYWIDKMTIWSIPSTFWDMLLGFSRDTNNPTTQIWLIVVLLFCLWIVYRFLKNSDSKHKWLVVFAIMAPFIGAILFYLKNVHCAFRSPFDFFASPSYCSGTSIYLDRYFLFAGVYFSLAVAVWLKEIKIQWLSSSLFVIYIILNLAAFGNYWKSMDVLNKPGMNALAKELSTNAESSGHHVFVGTSFEFFNLKYYLETYYRLPSGVRPLLYTGGRGKASEISHVEGVSLLTDADLLPEYNQNVHPADTVWVIWTNAFGSKKPENLPLNWTQIGEDKGFADVKPFNGAYIYLSEYKVN